MLFFLQSPDGSNVRRYISTDAVEQLKTIARRLKRAKGIPHHEALEAIARKRRFDNWHQVVEAHKAMLPTETAARKGVAIAMDPKEACGPEIVLPNAQGRFVEDWLLAAFFEDTFYRMARDDEDDDGVPGRERYTEKELRDFAREDMENHVFYRFEGARAPDAPEVAKLVAAECFFGPELIWIGGVLKRPPMRAG